MSRKTRGNYRSFCIKDCKNRDKACHICRKFNYYVPKEKGKEEIVCEE